MERPSTAPIPAHPPKAEYRHFIWDTRRWNAFKPRPGDIFVCTPPKCGTTWTQTIVAMLLFPDGNLPQPVMHLAPWLDARFYPLDETIAIYIGKILGTDYHMAFVKNGHPMVPLSTLTAGHRLMMHGLDCEAFHGWLRLLKQRQALGLSLDPRNPIGTTPA